MLTLGPKDTKETRIFTGSCSNFNQLFIVTVPMSPENFIDMCSTFLSRAVIKEISKQAE